MDLFQRADCEKVMAFHEAWDSITKNNEGDDDSMPEWAKKEPHILDSYFEAMNAPINEANLTEEEIQDEIPNERCCRILKETINQIPIDSFAMRDLHQALEDETDCERYAQIIEVQLEVFDYDHINWKKFSPSQSNTFLDDLNDAEYRRLSLDGYHDWNRENFHLRDEGFHPEGYDPAYEEMRINQIRQAYLAYKACKHQVKDEQQFSQAYEAHPLFTASSDPFEAGWDSITKIEIEVDSYDELIMKSEIPPFPMGEVGGGVTPEQMEWMLRYGQRIDPAMPQRAMAHLGGPFVAPRSKAVFVNPANPNKVFKLNAGATLPIAFSHALAAMGYPVAPMTPMATFSTPNEYQDDAMTSVIAQDRLDVVPSIGSGRRKSWPEGGDSYFDEYTWADMFRDNIAGSKFGGRDIPEDSASQWFDPEADYTRAIDFLQRQGVDMEEWAKDFIQANRENPDKFKPRKGYGKDTPQNRLVQALNDELRRYRELDIQPGYNRYTDRDTGEIKRYSNIGGSEWEDPLLRFLQMDTYSTLGPNIGLDEQGRPILTSFGIRGSPTMRVGTGGYDSPSRPMLGPRKEGVESDARDRAARVMFGQPLRARKVGFEIDPIYGIPRIVEESVMREQDGSEAILDAETMQPLPYGRRLVPRYSNMSVEEVMEQNPHYQELFGTTPEGYDISQHSDFMAYHQGLPYLKTPPYKETVRDWDSDDREATKVVERKPFEGFPYGRIYPDSPLAQFLTADEMERVRLANLPADDWLDSQEKNEREEEVREAALKRLAAAGQTDGYENYRQFDVGDQLRYSPIMRYLYANPGKKAIFPVNNARSFNTPGNDDDTYFLFPNPMPQFMDPNQDIYGMGREYERGGRRTPFNDGSGRTFPRSFRMIPDTPNPVDGEEFEITGGSVVDPETGKKRYESAFAEGYEDMFEGRRFESNRPRKVRGGPRFVDPMDYNPNSGFIRTIGAIHDSYPLPESTRLAELLANMPDRSLFDANPKQQRIYDKFMTAFPKDIEFWQAMSDNPMMSNDEAFALFNRIRGSYD